MVITKEIIFKLLKAKGLDINKLVTSEGIFDRACEIVYYSFPIPARWFVGKNRIRFFLNKIRESIPITDRDNNPRRKSVTGYF